MGGGGLRSKIGGRLWVSPKYIQPNFCWLYFIVLTPINQQNNVAGLWRIVGTSTRRELPSPRRRRPWRPLWPASCPPSETSSWPSEQSDQWISLLSQFFISWKENVSQVFFVNMKSVRVKSALFLLSRFMRKLSRNNWSSILLTSTQVWPELTTIHYRNYPGYLYQDGNSAIGAHVWCEIWYLIWFLFG